MEDIHKILDALDSSSAGSVLATVVQVTGSAYKKEGAAMLFKPDGTQSGFISAGCLEEDLAARLKHSGELNREIVYDMRSQDDLSWGEGSGCNGVICVWTEKINEEYAGHLTKLKQILRAGRSVLMLKKLAGTPGYWFIPDGEEAFGRWEGKVPSKSEFTGRGLVFNKVLGSKVYAQPIQPKRRLIVFGAGPDARPLAAFAAKAGFSVTVCDWRPAYCAPAYFPDAEKLMVGFPCEILDQLFVYPDDCIVVMTHNFKRDQEILRAIQEKNIRYLGVLGSKKRTARLLGKKEIPEKITSPAGLAIQAQGAEEIAVSIVAQLIQISHSAKREETVCL